MVESSLNSTSFWIAIESENRSWCHVICPAFFSIYVQYKNGLWYLMVICHSHSSHSSFVACTCSESPVFTAAQFKQMNTYTTKSTKSKRFCGLAEWKTQSYCKHNKKCQTLQRHIHICHIWCNSTCVPNHRWIVESCCDVDVELYMYIQTTAITKTYTQWFNIRLFFMRLASTSERFPQPTITLHSKCRLCTWIVIHA